MTAILLLAAYLRIYHLDTIPYGLIPDEAMRGYDAASLWKTGADSFGAPWPLFLRSFDDYTPALYSYLSAPFVGILGLSALSTRLASAVVGVLTVALTYPLIRRPFGEVAALTAACLLAISPWHILASRTGTEWNLLAFGPILVICFAYRGLYRPQMLIIAGIAAGISLYGYAPIKAFLPLLMVGFVLFYRRRLYEFKKFAIIGLGLFILLALPIYLFSFTPEGLKRLNQVYAGGNLSEAGPAGFIETIPQLIWNYFSYFSPKFFVLSQYADAATKPIFLAHLKQVGLLSWYELILIIGGIITIFWANQKKGWFILFWLIASPIGINLHANSPWPTLWLTAIPIPQALAGIGTAGLVAIARNKIPQLQSRLRPGSAGRVVAALLLVGLGIGIARHFWVMHNDLFYEYPFYGAKDGRKDAIQQMMTLKDQYDQVIIPASNLDTSIYVLFYTRYDPVQRQADLAAAPDQIWQKIDDYRIGQVEDFAIHPGCHLVVTTKDHIALLKSQFPQLMPVSEYNLPGGEPTLGLYALPSPLPQVVEKGVVFNNQIELQGFATTTTSNSPPHVLPGDSVCLILQWRAIADISNDYTVFTHLIGPASAPGLITQHDSPPMHGLKPTSTWNRGEVVQDIHRFTIPLDTPPGNYQITVGLYQPITGKRLPITPTTDQVTLISLEINDPVDNNP